MVKYQFTPWLSAYVRSGGDIYSNFTSTRNLLVTWIIQQDITGEAVNLFREINSDFLVTFDKAYWTGF